MDGKYTTLIGLIAGGCTTVSFVPQIIKIHMTGHARDVSLGMYLVLTSGIFLWLIYGLLIEDIPVIGANTIAFLLCCYIMYLKVHLKEG